MSHALFINGKWLDGEGSAFSSLNPANGETLWEGREASRSQTDAAITAAGAAFSAWSQRPLDERVSILRRFAGLLDENRAQLGDLIMRETGKARWDSLGEAGAMAAKLDISLKAYEERTGTHQKDAGGAVMQLTHHPHGVMGVIGPYNFPGHLPNGQIIPALIAGNTIVFKPSEITPLVAIETVRLWEAAGLPDGVLNLVQGARETGEQLVADTRVRGILFTGGVPAGTAIHRAMAGQPDRMLALEMGGNNPLIAWNIADKDAAAHVILRSAFISGGQRCTCARRLIVPDTEEGEAILSALLSLLDHIRIGDPAGEPTPFMGSLISAKAVDEVLAAQDDLVSKGGKIIRAAKRLDEGDAFVSPGIVDVTDAKDVPDREVFGPLLRIIRVATMDDAVREANDTAFGLAAGLLSDDRADFDVFAPRIRAGIVNWNRQTTGASSAAPFGGVGVSGNHRPAGYYSADFVAWPMSSLLAEGPVSDEKTTPGTGE